MKNKNQEIQQNMISIINAVLSGKDYEAMAEIYKTIGVEKVEEAIKYCEEADIKVPHIIMDVRGPLVYDANKNIIETILAGKDYKAMAEIYKTIGVEKVEEAIKYCEKAKIKVPHIIMDVRGPLVYDANKNIIETIQLGKDYKAMAEIYKTIGIDKVEEAIKYCEKANIKVPHIIMDVRGPLVHTENDLNK